jgi:peptidoglycan/xylan/chitin deacetylase (PgdA/CDA1 family)
MSRFNFTGEPPAVYNTVSQGYSKGLFDLSTHGWNHVRHSQLSLPMQIRDLQIAQNKMMALFGTTSTIYFPPNNSYNNDTVIPMDITGYNIISLGYESSYETKYIYSINHGPFVNTDPYGIIHIPFTVPFAIEPGQRLLQTKKYKIPSN